MRLPIPIALVIALAACNVEVGRSEVSIEDAWVRLPAVPGQPAAGYATVSATPERIALTGVSSPEAGRIEMHETMTQGTTASMRLVDRIDLRKTREIVFAPGGRHLMLFDVDPALKPGDHAELIFRFAHGKQAAVQAQVVAAGDEPPSTHEH